MKRYKWIHCYGNSTGTQQLKQRLSIPVLLVGILLFLPFIGCGVIMPEGAYEAPELPKSELVTIQVDTEGQWLQRPNLIVFRIDGKLALREKIESFEEVSFEEILVAPGKHEMSVLVVYESFHANTSRDRQILSRFSADVKAGSTYLLKDEDELVDADTGKVVSKSKFFLGQTAFEME